MLNAVGIIDPAKPERAGGQATEQIGENGGHPQSAKQHHGGNRSTEQGHNQCQSVVHKKMDSPMSRLPV